MNNNLETSLTMDHFEKVCRSKGLKMTHQRTEIFRTLLKQSNHPTIEDIFDHVRKRLKTISLDTVYRTISTFEEYGLVKRVHHIDNATRLDTNIENHHHLICSECSKIEDFSWSEFDQMQLPRSISNWEQTQIKHVVISGVCYSCKMKKK